MHNLVKILVVENEMTIGARISMHLSSLGYEVTGVLPRGEEVLNHIKEDTPDIIILDVHLKGKMDGIETAASIEQYFQIPVIYLTANADNATFNRARTTRPAAFISKPFKKLDLQRAIELTISRMGSPANNAVTNGITPNEEPFILNDRIFIRYKEKMVKIMIADILYIEAERNYSRIITTGKEYLLSTTESDCKLLLRELQLQRFRKIICSFIATHVVNHTMGGSLCKPEPDNIDRNKKNIKRFLIHN